MNTNTPVAWVIDTHPSPSRPGAWLLLVACPYCGGRHIHGNPTNRTDYGHRSAHCPYGSGYTLRDPDPCHLTREDLWTLTAGCHVHTKAGTPCRLKRTGSQLGHACRLHAWMPPAAGPYYQKAVTRV